MDDLYDPTALPYLEGDERRRHLVASVLRRAAAIPPSARLSQARHDEQARYRDSAGRATSTDTGNGSTIESTTDSATMSTRPTYQRPYVPRQKVKVNLSF